MKKLRITQCSGRVVRGSSKGDRCKRTMLFAVDKNDNTRLFWCVSHVTQKRAR